MKRDKYKRTRIIRTRKKRNYFVASNEPFNDERLSWGARGILAYLLSKPDSWEVYKKDLYQRSPDKGNATDRYFKELQECGYIRRYRTHDEEGKFVWLTEVYESPALNPDRKFKKTSERPDPQKPSSGKPSSGKPSGGEPSGGFTIHGKSGPIISTDTVVNTEKINTDIVNTDGTAGRTIAEKLANGAKTAAAADNSISITILNALKAVSNQMPRPLQAPELLIEGLLARGETQQTVTNAWKTCQTNGYKPAGAFICWIKSGYLPQQTASHAKNGTRRPTPPSSAAPPPPISGVRQVWAERLALLAQIE